MSISYNEAANVNDLIEKLTIFARRKGYKTNKVGHDILEIDKSGTWRLLTGLSSSLRILAIVKSNKTEVDLGNVPKEFIIKAVIFFMIFFISQYFRYGLISKILPFVFVLPAYGAFRQYKLMEDIKMEINDYFNSL